MSVLFGVLARTVIRRPGLVVSSVLLLTAVLGGLASQAVTEDGVAVDNELTEALDTIDARFGDPQSVLQVVVQRSSGDVRSVEGLVAATEIQRAVLDDPVAATLTGAGGGPPVASFLAGAEQAVQQQGLEVGDLDDDRVRQLQEQALEELPEEIAARTDGLVGRGDVPRVGLLLFFQDTRGLDEDGVLDQQRELASVVAAADLPDGVSAEPFSFGLLLTGTDIGPEVGRLFGTALLIILLVLAVVYWVRPDAGRRLRLGRRTAADVGLTLAVIVLAVVWMQGLGVLLGPDLLGLIGYFSPQTQIVPILIVGLGVDFAIHLLARYRTEIGHGASPEGSLTTSLHTVGLTLLLCTAATAIGFLTNLASPVDFLATLGVLAAVGIVAAFLLTCTFLPAVRVLLDRRAQRLGRLPRAALASQTASRLPSVVGRTAWLADRAAVPTLLVALVLGGVGAFGFTQLDSEFELTDFVPQDEPMLETFEVVAGQFDGGFEETTQVLFTGPLATPGAHDGMIAGLQRAAEIDDVETLDGRVDGATLAGVLRQATADEELTGRLAEAGLREDLTVAEDADVAALYDLLVDEVPEAAQVLARTGDGYAARAELRTSAGQDGAVVLQERLRAAFEPAADAGVSVVPTSEEIVQGRIGEDIEDSQLLSLLIALGAAMALLVLHYTIAARRPLVGVLTVLPVALVLAWTFGTMAVTGIPLNPVTATLAALSIGIGVPFMIHVTSRYLEERTRAADRADAMRRTLTETGGALAGSAATTAIGFGVLVTSTLVPFEQLGYVIVYAIVYSLLAAVLVLPSLLRLWDRRSPVDDARPLPVGEDTVTAAG
jgi:uncharacterized protein